MFLLRPLTRWMLVRLLGVTRAWWSKLTMENSSPNIITWALAFGRTPSHRKGHLHQGKLSPPPPPPKAEPIWYNCTVVTETHKTSKELDDLVHGLDGYDNMQRREVEIGNAAEGLPGCLGDIYIPFEKEDMSEMFRRAFLEQMDNGDNQDRNIYSCQACRKQIKGRVITAMGKKFHPQCFVCTYCRKEFKDRTFKSDDEGKPYCFGCFEKLLGHYGSAHI